MDGIQVSLVYFALYFFIFCVTLVFASIKRAKNNESLLKSSQSVQPIQSRSPSGSPTSQNGVGFFKTPPGDIEIAVDDRLDESKTSPVNIEIVDETEKRLTNLNGATSSTSPVQVLFATTLRHSYLYNVVLLHIVAQCWYV